jgi:hypothetical protein
MVRICGVALIKVQAQVPCAPRVESQEASRVGRERDANWPLLLQHPTRIVDDDARRAEAQPHAIFMDHVVANIEAHAVGETATQVGALSHALSPGRWW